MIALLEMFGIFLFFAHEIVFLDVVAVNLILLGGGLFHAIEVAHLFDREVMGFKLVRLLVEWSLLLRCSVEILLVQMMGSDCLVGQMMGLQIGL